MSRAGGRCTVPTGRRDAFSARERSSISQDFHRDVLPSPATGVMRATKRGIIYELRFDAATRRVKWGVCLDRHWKRGDADHVTAAIQEIAYLIENKELLKKIDVQAADAIRKGNEDGNDKG